MRRRRCAPALAAAAVLLAGGALGIHGQSDKKGPVQPVPFSHKLHAGTMKLACKQCHPNPDPGETMTIAGADFCMKCHATVKAKAPDIQLIAAAAANHRPIQWKRVYRIPGYVDFSHRSHLDAGVKCQSCHGEVAQRGRLYREGDITMNGCMKCHIAKGASVDCSFCHEPLE